MAKRLAHNTKIARNQKVIYLRAKKGLKYKEIAEKLGLSETAVWRIFKRGY